MYSVNILNFQKSTTILNAHTKRVWKLIVCTSYQYTFSWSNLYMQLNLYFQGSFSKEMLIEKVYTRTSVHHFIIVDNSYTSRIPLSNYYDNMRYSPALKTYGEYDTFHLFRKILNIYEYKNLFTLK